VVLQRETAASKSDEEKLQGDWEMVGVEMDGEQMDLSKGAYRLSFVGDLMISTEHERNTIFKLDGTKSPKQFVQIWQSDWVGLKIVGIYSLEGDELRICNAENETDAPPDDFTAPKGSGRTLITLKRVKSAGDGAASSSVQGRVGGTGAEPASNKEAKRIKGDAKKFEDSRPQIGDLSPNKASTKTASVLADPNALMNAMEGFRTKLPPPVDIYEASGRGLTVDEDGNLHTRTHLRAVASRMGVKTRADCLILLTYLKDRDLKIRHIAAFALEGVVKAYPDGIRVFDLDQLDSEQHRTMVQAFVEKLDKLENDR
jgi:uncharacterized protein (TIGR03067 family)